MTLQFLQSASNAILVGPSGVGKTTIAQNIAHQAVLQGHTAMFTTAGKLLGELASLDSDSALRTRLRHYARPDLLVVDEVGYLSYSSRYADLLFELISRRHEHKSTRARPGTNGQAQALKGDNMKPWHPRLGSTVGCPSRWMTPGPRSKPGR